MIRQAGPLGCLALIPIALILLSALGLWGAALAVFRGGVSHGFMGQAVEPWQALIVFGALLALGTPCIRHLSSVVDLAEAKAII